MASCSSIPPFSHSVPVILIPKGKSLGSACLIAAKTSSIPELVGDHATLIEPKNSDSLAACVKHIIGHYDGYDLIAKEGRKHVIRNFNWSKISKEYEDIIIEILETFIMLTFNFNKITLPKGNSTMLDIGCGEGRHVFGVMQNFKDTLCIGLDMDDPSITKAREGYEFFKSISNQGASFIKGSAYSLPIPSNTLDLVICSEVLEHLDDYHLALEEIYRVLKPGGKFLASVPSYWPEKICWMISNEYQNMPGGHVRIFKKKGIIDDVQKMGFTFQTSERFHSIHSPYWWLRCLFWDNQDSNILIRIYKRILEKHILENPFYIDLVDKVLNPVLGKSLALYFEKKV